MRKIATLILGLVILLLLSQTFQVSGDLEGLGNATDESEPLDTFVAWSPDGSRLLYTHITATVPISGGWQVLTDLWEMDFSADAPRLIAANAAYPTYSPDGSRIAYLSFQSEGRAQLGVWEKDQTRLIAAADWGVAPQWTDDATAILFARGGRTWLTTPDGAEQRPLVAAPSRSPRLPPSTGRLVYVRLADDLISQLWVANADGSEARLLVSGQMEYFSRPSLSPNGGRIAFSRTQNGSESANTADIWLVDVTGENLRNLTANDTEESDPVWSADGRRLAFHR